MDLEVIKMAFILLPIKLTSKYVFTYVEVAGVLFYSIIIGNDKN